MRGRESRRPSFERMVADMSETMRHVLMNSPATLDHLKEARASFEMTIAQIAARKRTMEDVEDLRRILAEQEQARLDSNAFLEADGRFHHRIAVITGNPIFANLSQALFAWLARFHFDLVRKPGLEQLTLAEHRQILEAIERGEPDEAARLTGGPSEPRQYALQSGQFSRLTDARPLPKGCSRCRAGILSM